MFSKFHGWKRKAGLVTLTVACLFAAGWVRGSTVQDLILLGAGQRVVTKGDVLVILTSSARDGFVWSTDRSEGITWLSGWQVRPTAGDDYFDPFASNGNSLVSNSTDYHWKLFGFEAAKYHGREDGTFTFWRISYLSIVIPLTVLSAYLLLSKSRIAI